MVRDSITEVRALEREPRPAAGEPQYEQPGENS